MISELKTIALSGSYRKFPEELAKDLEHFHDLGVKVLSPHSATILSSVDDFVLLQDDPITSFLSHSDRKIPQAMRFIENGHLRAIQQSDALWLVLPQGYCGVSTSFEIGWALAHNVPVFYDGKYRPVVREPIIRSYATAVQSIDHLVSSFSVLPKVDPKVMRNFQQQIYAPQTVTTPFNASVAVGPLLVNPKREILLVKTHKWGGRYSIPGERINPGERIETAVLRAVKEQTGLSGTVDQDLCTFDELPESGYFRSGTSRVFVDKVVLVNDKLISLDHRAESAVWVNPVTALRDLDIEPNARKTVEVYAERYC